MFHVDFNLNHRFAWLRSGNVPNPFRDACIAFGFLFAIVHPKKQDVQMKVHQPQVSLLVHKKTSLWPRIRHCLKRELNYFNKTRACFYFDLTVCVLFLSLLWFGLQLLSLCYFWVLEINSFECSTYLFSSKARLCFFPLFFLQSLNHKQMNMWLKQAKDWNGHIIQLLLIVASDWFMLTGVFPLFVSLRSVFTAFQAFSLCVAWQHVTVDHALSSFETIFKEQT